MLYKAYYYSMRVEIEFKDNRYRAVENRESYIAYCLYCPLTKKIAYIGITNQGLRQRLSGHISDALGQTTNKTRKAKWLKSVIEKYGAVYARVLCKCNGLENARKMEDELIIKISKTRKLINTETSNCPQRIRAKL